jgi:hypothetical protein
MDAAMEGARRAYYAASKGKGRAKSTDLNAIYQRGYNSAVQEDTSLAMQERLLDQGFARGYTEAEKHMARHLSAARLRGYNEGFQSGMRSGGQARPTTVVPTVDERKLRSKLVDEMLQECRVIAESNPNMAPGPFANAVRHRIKKLRNT